MQSHQPERIITEAKVEYGLVWFKVNYGAWQTASELRGSTLISEYLEKKSYIISGICDSYVVYPNKEHGAVVYSDIKNLNGKKRKRETTKQEAKRSVLEQSSETKKNRPQEDTKQRVRTSVELRDIALQTVTHYPGRPCTFGFMGNEHINVMELDHYGFVAKLVEPYHQLDMEIDAEKRGELNAWLQQSWLSKQRNADELGTFLILLSGSMGRVNVCDNKNSVPPPRKILEDDQVIPFVKKLIYKVFKKSLKLITD